MSIDRFRKLYRTGSAAHGTDRAQADRESTCVSPWKIHALPAEQEVPDRDFQGQEAPDLQHAQGDVPALPAGDMMP